MKNNKKWFSIVFAMWMALISTLMVIYMLEYMIPFSKNVKGIENSTAAYYQTISAIEEALYFITVESSTLTSESWTILPWWAKWYAFQTYSSWTTLPSPWYGNSEFDTNWSRLRTWEPVQIRLPAWIIWNNTSPKIFFRIPSFTGGTVSIDTLLPLTDEFINWQLSGTGNTLNSISTSRFKWSDIYDSWTSPPWIALNNKSWKNLSDTALDIEAFYGSNCTVDFACTLKLSVINTLKWKIGWFWWKVIPYLEYKIVFPINVPSNIVRINVKWKSYGFQKEFDIYSPRESLIEAYDFTVFQ